MIKSRYAVLAAVMIFGICASAGAADTMWDFQQVDSIGYGIHPKVWADETDPDNRVTVEGVALAGFDEILNPNEQYTVFLQDDASDRGGIQAWTGKFFYGQAMWDMLRTTDYVNFRAGDRLRITGLLADMGRGKVVINNRGHSGSPLLVWHVDVIGHSGLPDPELVPSVSHCNYFDASREGGGERYQTRYIMLHGVEIESGQWGADQLMSVADATGSVGVLLSAMGDFPPNTEPQGRLNIVGIMDQEDDQSPPYADGYRVWVVRSSHVAAALDACRHAANAADGERVALVNKIVSRAFDGFFYIQDSDRSGGVRVNSDRAVAAGDVVCVQGIAEPTAAGRAIAANYLTISDQAHAPRPVCVTSPTLWGESWLDVDGLLVRVFGTIGSPQVSGTYDFVDDAGRTISLKANDAALPEPGTPVVLTAVAARNSEGPMLFVAEAGDVQTID